MAESKSLNEVLDLAREIEPEGLLGSGLSQEGLQEGLSEGLEEAEENEVLEVRENERRGEPRSESGKAAESTQAQAQELRSDATSASGESKSQRSGGLQEKQKDPDFVTRHFIRAGSEFYYRKEPEKLAFSERDGGFRVSDPTESVAVATVEMAISRGWKGIRVRGTPEFRRLVWKAATDRGLGFEGYRAGPGEKALRNEKQRERQEKQSGKQAGKQAGETTGDGKHSRPAPSPGFWSPEAKDSEPAERKEKPFSGEILNYGPAPYNHDPNNRPSFFVTIRAPDGTEATHWGLGLERAREEARANIGDHVKLTRHDRAITASKYATWSIQVYNPEILDGKEAEPQASSAESQVTDKPLVEGEKEPVSETQKPGEQGAQTSAPEKVETSELPNSRGNTPDRQEVQQHQQDPGTKIVEDFTEKRLKNWTPEEREAFQERFRELRSILSATEPDKGGAKTSDREHEHER